MKGRHRRLELRLEHGTPHPGALPTTGIRPIKLPAHGARSMAGYGIRRVWIFSILLVLIVAQSTFAASRGYLATVGPAPLRFDNSKRPEDDKALLQPYVPDLLNPDPNAAAREPAHAATPEPGAASTSQPVEPPRPRQPESSKAQSGAGEPDDQSLRNDTAARPDSVSRQDPPAIDESDLGAMEPEYQAAPLTPQMLLHYFEKRSGASGESESGILVPMIFTPPPAPPHHSSKATYQRSFE